MFAMAVSSASFVRSADLAHLSGQMPEAGIAPMGPFDAVALNPQPLPPRESGKAALAGSLSRFDAIGSDSHAPVPGDFNLEPSPRPPWVDALESTLLRVTGRF